MNQLHRLRCETNVRTEPWVSIKCAGSEMALASLCSYEMYTHYQSIYAAKYVIFQNSSKKSEVKIGK